MRDRKPTRKVTVGPIAVGGDAPVSVQTMTNVPLDDVQATISQINRLAEAGADIVRVAILDEESVAHLRKIIPAVNVPVTADVHFNYRIAIEAIKAGVSKVRINPGNIGDESRVREVVQAARDHGVPIRIGVNGGSLDRKKYPAVTPETIVASALEHISILEELGFYEIIVSLKSSDVANTIAAYRLFAQKRDYPLHVGLTEAGYGMSCTVQSSIAIGHLLLLGLGDTIRVSMTGDPLEEVLVGKKILETVGDRVPPVRIISCPTCGRTDTRLDILAMAKQADEEINGRFAERLRAAGRSLVVAVMGCEVNGPGEAKHADVGLAGGRNGAFLLFAKGEKIKSVREDEAIEALVAEVEKIVLI